MQSKESIVQRQVSQHLKKDGWLVVKIIQCTLNGFPDLMALKNGKAVFIEVKSSKGKPSALQLHRQQELINQNFQSIVIYELNQLRSFLQEQKY